MKTRLLIPWFVLGLSTAGAAADLSVAPSNQLLQVYAKLRDLQGGDQSAVTENVAWKRDCGTFMFRNGRLSFAAPVEGRVLAAVFAGEGSFELDPPTAIARNQLARFVGGPKLEASFREAVFLFTDGSWDELQKLVNVRPGADSAATGRALAAAQRKYSETFNEWWENERKGSFAIRNLAARMLADLTDPSSRGFFLADLKTEHQDELFYHISWNRDPLLRAGVSTDEEVSLTHHKRGEYTEWWAGFHLRDEYAKNPHPEHRTLLAHCRKETIDAEVDKSNHLSATAEMEFEVSAVTARVVPFSLQGVLRISAITDEAGKKLSFIQEDRKLDSDPWLILPEPAAAGKTYKIKIAYEEDSTRDSRIIYQRGSGLYYVTSRESWFPSFGAFDDRAQYTMHFRSPKKYKFVGTGRLVSSEKEKDGLVTEWQSEIPYAVVGFNYGDFVEKSHSDSDLTVTAYTGREIPDALKSLESSIDMAELAGGPGGEKNVAGKMGIATGGFNTASQANYAAGVSYQALKLYQYYFGALPFKNVAVTEQPVLGYGQSWPTLIFLPYDSLLDATTRHQLRLQDSAEEREFYSVVAVHEMAHQWWGHLVGWKTYHDEWLSEGFSDFSAALYLRKFDPKKFRSFWDLKRRNLFDKNRVGHRPIEVGPLWLGLQLPAHLEEFLYDQLVYYKGAYVLEMLRLLLQDPKSKEPDMPFILTMRDFVSTYAGKNASTEDFRRVVEKHTGQPMDWFFNEWVYGTEIPNYDFSYELTDAGSGKTQLKMSLAQSNVSDSFLMRVPVYFYTSGEPHWLGMVQVRGATTATGNVTLPFRPEKISIDDTHSVLCTTKQ